MMKQALQQHFSIDLKQNASTNSEANSSIHNNVKTTRNQNLTCLITAISNGSVNLKQPEFKKELRNLVTTLRKATWLKHSNGCFELERLPKDFNSNAVTLRTIE